MPASSAPPQYCLLNWGRLNAFPLNYTSAQLHGSIGGVPLDPTHQSILIESLSVSDRLNEEPNTLIATIRGTKPREGQAITLTYGSLNAMPLFAGTILRVTQVWAANNPKYILCHVEATDPTWRLNEVLVTARYRSQSASASAADLLARFAPAGFTGAIEPNLPALDEITFTNTKLMDAFVQLATRIGGHALCDYRSVVHVFMATEAAVAPTPLTATHPSVAGVQYTRDLTQMVTRAIVQGGGANALARLPPGSTEIPVEDATWYSASGGLVVSGPQRIRYTGTRAGGGGSLTGSGAAPTSAPTLATIAGGSVTVGGHAYAYSWVSAQGETLVAPASFVTITSSVPTAIAPAVTVNVGTGLPPGTYVYAASHVLASGETAWTQGNQNAVCTRFLGTSLGAPGLRAWVTLPTNLGAIGDQMEARLAYRSTTALSPATVGPTSARVTLVSCVAPNAGKPSGLEVSFNLSLPRSANYLDVQVRNVTTGGAWGTVQTYSNVGGGGISAGCYVGTVTPTTAATETGGLDTASVQVTMAAAPAGTTSRRVYRTKVDATVLYLVKDIPGAALSTFIDTTPDSALVTRPPAPAGALQTVTVGGIALGPKSGGGGGGTTSRKVYRTPADSGVLKLLATIPDNTTTTFVDTQPDTGLGAGIPTTDTAGLVSDTGQVLAGAPTLPVSGTGPFPATGGWVLSGNNRIRYASLSGTALTGIPPAGDGSIQNTIPYGTPVTLAPSLTGIPATGAGAILWTILAGDPVDLLVIVDDLAAQATLKTLLGGSATGIREALIQDGRIGIPEATARGTALLKLQSAVLETLRHRSRDPNTVSGALVTVDLPPPTAITGTFRIQDVTVASFNPAAGIFPTYDAQSSSSRYTLEDLLRQLSRTDPPPTTGETP